MNIQNSFVWTEFGWQQVAQITEKCATLKVIIMLVLLLQNMRKEIRLWIVHLVKTTDGDVSASSSFDSLTW